MDFPSQARDFPFSRQIVELQATCTVEEAITTLLEQDILSLPVYDKKRRSYLGWFNISDLIPLFLALDEEIKSLSDQELTKERVQEVAKSFPFHEDFVGSESTLEDCFRLGVSPLFEWLPFSEDANLTNIIASLTSGGVKRVPIMGEDGKCVKIISQNAIMRFLNVKMMEIEKKGIALPEIFDRSVEDLGLLKAVETVDHATPVSDCLKRMIATKHSALGITDEGKMFLVITNRDLLKFKSLENIALNRLGIELRARDFQHGLEEHQVDKLLCQNLGRALEDMSIADFVSFVRQSDPSKPKAQAAVISVLPTSKLRKVMAKMSKAKVHRIFICKNKEALGIVSVRDIIRIMFPR